MKTIYTIVLWCFCQSVYGQLYVGNSFKLGLPQGGMKTSMNTVGNYFLDARYSIPSAKQVSVGAEIGVGNYATLREPVTFNFGNGNPTSTFINYSSNVAGFNGFLQYDLLSSKVNIVPYVQAKAGVQSMYSRIFIEDPNDVDGCRPLESKSIKKDYTATIGGAVGVRFAIKSKRSKAEQFLDFGMSCMTGGEIEYINTKRLKDHSLSTITNTPTDPEATPVNMNFVNVTSNVVHTHKVGELYSNTYKMLDIKISYIFKLR